jgi:hypothetical protein
MVNMQHGQHATWSWPTTLQGWCGLPLPILLFSSASVVVFCVSQTHRQPLTVGWGMTSSHWQPQPWWGQQDHKTAQVLTRH